MRAVSHAVYARIVLASTLSLVPASAQAYSCRHQEIMSYCGLAEYCVESGVVTRTLLRYELRNFQQPSLHRIQNYQEKPMLCL